MKIYFGSDHNGYELKQQLMNWLKVKYEVFDMGNIILDPTDDYPDYAKKVVIQIQKDKEAKGILICGSGAGMCIAANRYRWTRAVLSTDHAIIKASRHDDDTNILCLPALYIELAKAKELVDLWLNTKFEGAERFVRRIEKMDKR